MLRSITIEGLITQAKTEDLHKPWIRVSKTKRKGIIDNKDFVKVKANNKTAYCQIRGTSDEDSEEIEMSEHYRELLGWNQIPKEKVTLEIVRINQTCGIFKAIDYHPDDFVRLGIGLFAVSVSLALISLLISILQSITLASFWLTISIVLITVLGIILFISMVVIFLRPLKRGKTD
jgi:hypothetical protein